MSETLTRPPPTTTHGRLIARWFTPSPAGLLLFAFLLALELLAFKSTTAVSGHSSTMYRYFGVPTLVEVITAESPGTPTTTTYNIHWLACVWVFLACWCLTMPLGRLLSVRPGWQWNTSTRKKRHPARILFLVIAGTVAAAALVATLFSYHLWGFYLSRPALDSRIPATREILSITPVVTINFPTKPELTHQRVKGKEWWQDQSLADILARGKDDSYYLLEGRSLAALPHSLHATSATPMPEDQLAGLYALAESAGMLLPGDPGYPNAKDLWGLVYHLKGPAGEELLLLALRGGEISNDHYPYYEFFFTRTSAGTWQFDSAHRFFFDIAGMEGAEFFALTLGFSILGLAITVPITIAFLLYRAWHDYRCAIPSLEVVLPNKSA